MKCPKCDSDNCEEVNFSEECGVKSELGCLSCKAKIPPGKKICGKCDQNLTLPSKHASQEFSFDQKYRRFKNTFLKGLTKKTLSHRGRIQGARKQVTVMFCGMESFTLLLELLVIDKAYVNMGQVHKILIHKVHDFEGMVRRSFSMYQRLRTYSSKSPML